MTKKGKHHVGACEFSPQGGPNAVHAAVDMPTSGDDARASSVLTLSSASSGLAHYSNAE